MGGRRTTKEELEQIEILTEEGLATKEIAEKLNRTPASIRNLRYKKHLVACAKNETKELLNQKERLTEEVEFLHNKTTLMKSEIEQLKKDKGRLEQFLVMDRFLLEQILSQALVNLKTKKPELFTFTRADQIALILKALLK